MSFPIKNKTPFQSRVQADWQKQESHLQRKIGAPESLTDLISRLEKLISCLEENEWIESEELEPLRKKLTEVKAFDPSKHTEEENAEVYCELRWLARDVIFSNKLLKDTPLVFMKGNSFGYQVMQDYLSYYARYCNFHGGGIFRLNKPGYSFEATELTSDFPRGHYSTLNLSYDAKEIFFAFADFSKVQDPKKPQESVLQLRDKGRPHHILDYIKESEGKYHLYKMNLATGEVQQLTDGPHDDYDATLLPDGSLVYVSTARGGFARCNQCWEPISTATLHKRNLDGKVECLSWHETNEWSPSVLSDGRVIYTRWDYVDRSASRYHGLWLTNPNGTGAASLFGNYTEDVCVCIQPKQIPNSNKIMFLAAAHHLGVGGSLVILDPTKVAYDPKTGFDDFSSIERITPEIPFPETNLPGQATEYHIPDHYYYSPYPLSEDFYLVSYSHDPMGGYLPTHGALTEETVVSGKLGLYYRDRFGNLELMYEDDEYGCRYPTLLKERETIPAETSPQLADTDSETGTFSLVNVYESLWPFPENRKVKELRIFQILPRFPSHAGNDPPVAHDFAGNARLFLGTVPVEEDGSAHFTAPAKKPLYFQAVDEQGKAVQTMLSEVYLQPGENRGCVGCHEQAQTTADNSTVRRMALTRSPSEIVPGPEGTRPFSYPLLVQPILDRSCVSCHHKNAAAKPVLTGEKNGHYTLSYNNLKPYLRWYEWLDATIRRTVSLPGQSGADMSPLTAILEDDRHKDKMNLSEEDRRILYLWLDGNIQFYGVYDAAEQLKQQNGEKVPVPNIQ